MMYKHMIDNPLIRNKIYKIPLFCLMNNQGARHVQTNICNNAGHYALRSMKLFMKVTKKHAREDNFWIERKIDWTRRNTNIIWDRIGEKHAYAKYASNRNRKRKLS